MSLINEALRKARKDAAERDAESKGVTYRPPRAHLPAERPWLGALMGGIALGVLVAGLAYFVLRPETVPEPVPEPVLEQSPVPPHAVAESPEPEDEAPVEAPKQAPPQTPAQTPQAAEPTPESMPEVSGTSATLPEDDSATPEPDAQSGTSPETGGEAKRIRPPAQVGQVAAEVYVLEAEKDGVTLRLDFIVWAPPNPFAQINGRQVSVGQTVEGFLVRAIEREEVTLEGEDGSFRLRVR